MRALEFEGNVVELIKTDKGIMISINSKLSNVDVYLNDQLVCAKYPISDIQLGLPIR